MKRENIVLAICFGIMVLISTLLLVFQQTLIPTTKVDKLFNQKVQLSEEEYIKSGNIIYKQEVKNIYGKSISTLYMTSTKNSFGTIELFIGIDHENRVRVIDKKIDQTSSYVKQVRNYILQNYQNIYFENIQFIDGAAGGTTINVSRKTIKDTVIEVVNYHLDLNVEEKDYIYELLNETYTTVSSKEENNVFITQVEVKDQVLTVYKTKDQGVYFGQQEGSVTLLIAVDNQNKITHVSLPQDLYEHTPSFAQYAIDYVNGLIGKLITEELPSGSGATNSITLIKTMIEKIQEVDHE